MSPTGHSPWLWVHFCYCPLSVKTRCFLVIEHVHVNVNVCQTLKFTNESHKDEQRSRKLTPGGSAHVTTECESVCDF